MTETFPHCNAEVLHAPGTCKYCDAHPERQQMRIASNTPFTPAEANGWGGNVARPARLCHWCSLDEEDSDYGPFVDVLVITSEGEEGYAFERRYFCNDCLMFVSRAFVELGFGNHRHGGINYLEDHRCPGSVRMEDCETPDADD